MQEQINAIKVQSKNKDETKPLSRYKEQLVIKQTSILNAQILKTYIF